jgi:hypothetical protein
LFVSKGDERILAERFSRAVKSLLTVAVFTVATLSCAQSAPAQEGRLHIEFGQRRLSASIIKVPLRDVLREFEEERNIWFDTGFVRDGSLLDTEISLQFEDASIKAGLERILSGINHSLFFRGDRLVGVMLLGKPEKRAYTPRPGYNRGPTVRYTPQRQARQPRRD